MRYYLQPDVSFCLVSGRVVFLDLSADRYFCLSITAERSFMRSVQGAALDVDEDALLARLTASGPLSCDRSHPPANPCPALAELRASMLDEPLPRPTLSVTCIAAASLFAAPLRLRTLGLNGAIRQLSRRKRRASLGPVGKDRLLRAITGFIRLRDIVTENDNCLVRSMAVANGLISAGATPQLIMGVKLQPFAAHAWVQSEDWLINERWDVVRDFTPILIV